MKTTRKVHLKAPDRVDKLITLLPHTKTKEEAMIKAGYAKTTAHSKHTHMNKMIEKRLLQYMQEDIPTDKYFSIEGLLQEYEKIITQDKDMSSKYKAIRSVLDKYPDILAHDNERTQNTPILNITVERIEQKEPTIKIDPISIDIENPHTNSPTTQEDNNVV